MEYSTAYFVAVPKNRNVTVWDTDIEAERQLEVKKFRLTELLDEFKKKIKRVLRMVLGAFWKKIVTEPSLQAEFEQRLKNVNNYKDSL